MEINHCNTAVVLYTLFLVSSCFNEISPMRMLPVYDIRTKEVLAFPDEFLKIVLKQQSADGDSNLLLYASMPLDDEGYIINQEGHLVPFKVYKKGGNRIHPRNCRPGYRYRKRTNVEALTPSSDKLYELDVFKRQITHQTNPDILHVYDPTKDDLYPHKILSVDKSRDDSLRDYQDRNEARNPISYGLINQREDVAHNKDKTAAVYHNIGDESELYKQILPSNQNAASSYPYQGIAEPPPPERQISAILEEYPLYDTLEELITKYNEHSGAKSDIFDPNDDLSLFAIQKRR